MDDYDLYTLLTDHPEVVFPEITKMPTLYGLATLPTPSPIAPALSWLDQELSSHVNIIKSTCMTIYL
jgi:hypothetical protein